MTEVQRRDRAKAENAKRRLRAATEPTGVVRVQPSDGYEEVARHNLLGDEHRSSEGGAPELDDRLIAVVDADPARVDQLSSDLLGNGVWSRWRVRPGSDQDRDVLRRYPSIRELAHEQGQDT